MTIHLREKRVGDYTVRELPMRETIRLLKLYPQGSEERGPGLLGASVFNGADEPLGLGVLDVGTGTYKALMAAHGEVNGELVAPAEGAEGNA